jgi:hypothetical protein
MFEWLDGVRNWAGPMIGTRRYARADQNAARASAMSPCPAANHAASWVSRVSRVEFNADASVARVLIASISYVS